MRGVMTLTANWPRGLSFGPVSTRAINPYVRGTSTHPLPVMRKITDMTTTPPATMRADVSFAGLGKENNFDTRSAYAGMGESAM